MELINKDTPQVKEFISSLDLMLNGIESIVKHYKPHLNGERFLSDRELSERLKISRRTLQEYRNEGKLPYIQLGGKVLYKESDIERMLQNGYKEAWQARQMP